MTDDGQKRVGLYGRVSSDPQTDSLDGQLGDLREHGSQEIYGGDLYTYYVADGRKLWNGCGPGEHRAHQRVGIGSGRGRTGERS